jgi:hypothetical protein
VTVIASFAGHSSHLQIDFVVIQFAPKIVMSNFRDPHPIWKLNLVSFELSKPTKRPHPNEFFLEF